MILDAPIHILEDGFGADLSSRMCILFINMEITDEVLENFIATYKKDYSGMDPSKIRLMVARLHKLTQFLEVIDEKRIECEKVDKNIN